MTTENNLTIIPDISLNATRNGTLSIEADLVFQLHVVDAVIVCIYLVFSICLGIYFSRRHKTASDFFLASRSTKWPFIGLSLYASNISSSTLVGLAGSGYSLGISSYNYEWMATLILIVFAIFFIPTLLEMQLYTMPEYLERRYNITIRCYLSLLSLLINLIGSLSVSLYAGALIMKMIVPQLEMWHTIAILAIIAGIYTICGGLAAVIYTDAIQAIALFLGSVIIAVCTLIKAGGWNAVKHQVPPDHLKLIQPVDDDSFVPWTGLLTGIPLLGFYFWCCNQSIAQRVLSSKDVSNGRWGCLLAGLLKLPSLFIMVLPGTMAKVIYPDLTKGDLVYPTLLFTLLPVGVLGIVLSGFLAALMSQIDSVLNSTATLVTIDFVKRFRPGLTEKQLMNTGRVVTFIFMVLAVGWAPLLGRFKSIFGYFQTMMSYLIPPVTALYLVGFFWKGANATGAIIAVAIGNVCGIILFIFIEVMGWLKIHFLHIASILFLLSILILVGASLILGKPCSDAQLKATWSAEHLKADIEWLKSGPFWKNYLFYSFLLTVVAAIIVGCFW